MKNYLYSDFVTDIATLSHTLKSYEFDAIVAITRGGMMPAQALSHALNIRNVQSIQAISYEGKKKSDTITLLDTTQLKGAKGVLVVDDIADSGDTLKEVLSHLKSRYSDPTFKSCTLFYKPSASIMPDFTCNIATEWINFFWEIDFTT